MKIPAVARRSAVLCALGLALSPALGDDAPLGGDSQALERGYRRPSAAVAELPHGLDLLIDAALEPDPARRIHFAAEFWAGLDALNAAGIVPFAKPQ